MKKILKLVPFILIPLTNLSLLSCQSAIIDPQLNQTFNINWYYEVSDGDTFYFTNDTIKQGVRLFGVDTPETYKNNKQKLAKLENYYGQKAKAYLNKSTYQRNVKIQYITKDKYNRWVCKVYDDKGEDLALKLIERGLARVSYISIDHRDKYYWVNNKQQKEYFWKLNKAQNEAQRNKLGFWNEKDINLVFSKN
ncbi:thermonuclease family protein [Mycoplasmopsis caviae]|uniref:Thermonuclease n=1 Tax=Mycoplasmopsis caviae TaxID=55603 RepID=A0A3P8KMR8_9BACT|nr:thermonuclease family protein [Mycoplasmopsis caviae]UUD35056.1 thermonuclease family protein [Mycoplasmopsis caviae]VDR42118.1 Thermonuclease precursor [Mycoplasmopsis caviae]